MTEALGEYAPIISMAFWIALAVLIVVGALLLAYAALVTAVDRMADRMAGQLSDNLAEDVAERVVERLEEERGLDLDGYDDPLDDRL